jgi:hypothetical protein
MLVTFSESFSLDNIFGFCRRGRPFYVVFEFKLTSSSVYVYIRAIPSTHFNFLFVCDHSFMIKTLFYLRKDKGSQLDY